MADGICTENPFDEHWTSLFRKTICDYAGCPDDIAEGQPFLLDAIAALARLADDPDSHFPLLCKDGLPLGVEETLPDTSHIWPDKGELAGTDDEMDTPAPPAPTRAENYPSAAEHEDAIEATYIEERSLGLVYGPLTEAEAAALCGCSPHQLCHGDALFHKTHDAVVCHCANNGAVEVPLVKYGLNLVLTSLPDYHEHTLL